MSQLRHFILIFDMPSGEHTLRKKIYRLLKKTGAKKLQISVWESGSLANLIKVANIIRIAGGKAIVLEKKLVF